ncbi:hypothetical protein FDB15_07320 [Clostridium botulinum]|uniref:hypothetical protein n=1 Tax=unclassified Clostridium TaxID=2614128 RepID=UPI0013C65FAF|nr:MULTISPECIES: hypothetical protein [unclassified Clostridium]MBY7007689.1 hypothetical protein [Clostridium botulinum]NFH72037.1 hypothetical protein [Clostridium botulinum]NFI00423.1 hypothetical protein [Clostridium botulinum]NFI62743.1 hypothetical protein [Clostridium botulinum]NFI80780.1 hypothetical protein [Clostridium botulinum]
MHNSKIAWFRAIMFLVVFVLINNLIVFIICPKGNYSRNTLREMYATDKNIDIVCAGSSYTIKGINPYIMDEKLECNTLDYSFSAQIYTGTYYSLKELFKYHKPRQIVLTTDIFNYTFKEENVMAYIPVVSYFKNLFPKIDFFINSAQDGSYLDRIFLWRQYHVTSLGGLINNIKYKKDPNYISYPTKEQLDVYKSSKDGYAGKGFVRVDTSKEENVLNDNKIGKVQIVDTDLDEIKLKNVEYFRKIAKLCKENDSELILIQTPVATSRIYSFKNYFKFSDKIGEIAKEEGVKYYNYNLIKPELFKKDTSYFQDQAHLNGKGADAFTESFAQFLKIKESGEDISKYFYTPDEYFNSINYINNTWFTNKTNKTDINLKADSFYGGQVIPEYQFVLTDSESGESTIIRDYYTDSNLTIKKPSLSKYKIRVNAREKGSDVEYSRYYEEEFKK